MKTFHLVSLGCAKNLVDSEVMLGVLDQAGYQYITDPGVAEIIIINTCGFIQPAVEEAIEEILDHVSFKDQGTAKYLVVTGCLVQRYKEKLEKELPEVDLFIGTESIHQIAGLLDTMQRGDGVLTNLVDRVLMDHKSPRILATPSHRAWMKITEGCNNHCSYCMIPSIRGELRSRGVDDLTKEAVMLEGMGVKEVSLIAQDLTAFGNEKGENSQLKILLDSLLKNSTIPWLRLLYLYPSGIDDELIEKIAESPRIVPYLDIPFQHVNSTILRKMNRNYTKKDLYNLVDRLRDKMPNIALRTTFLLGFPGETDENVEEVEKFIKDVGFDHLGVFGFCNEDGCAASKMIDQCADSQKVERVNHIMSVQKEISANKLKRFVGRTEQVIIEGVSKETDLLLEGRTKFQAPEIDGCVYITEGEVRQGDIVDVEIYEAQAYDLVGRIVQ